MNLATILHLERPLAVLDLETTGLDTERDRIVQIALTIHYPHKDPIPWVSLVNPGIPIPPGASKVHGITDEQVKTAHPFKVMAQKLAKTLTDVDFCGHNIARFDLKLLRAEMRRAGEKWDWDVPGVYVIDTQQIYFTLRPRHLADAYKEFVSEAGFQHAHDAGADVRATEAVLDGQLRMYPNDIPRDVKRLAEYCWPKDPNAVDASGKFTWKDGEVVIAFGKHRGTSLRQMDKGYLQWICSNDFPADVKFVAAEALEGRFPTK